MWSDKFYTSICDHLIRVKKAESLRQNRHQFSHDVTLENYASFSLVFSSPFVVKCFVI